MKRNQLIINLKGMLLGLLIASIILLISMCFHQTSKTWLATGWLCGIGFTFGCVGYIEKKENLIKKFNDSLELLYNHVGFTPDWVICPINDCTQMYWSTDGKVVKFAETIKKYYSEGDYYLNGIYTQRFYKKHIYRGQDYTMIFSDPHVDGMKYFSIFDNKKELKS